MCERRDSIEAMSAAADRLSKACEAEIHGVPEAQLIDPRQPTRAGIARALSAAHHELTTTPADMAVQLRRIK